MNPLLKKMFLLILLCIGMGAASSYAAANLVVNMGFEEPTVDISSTWFKDVWNTGDEATRFTITSEVAHSGNHSVLIENNQPNDAKWVQKVKVKPSTKYRLFGWIKVKQVGPEGSGANLSVVGVLETSADLRDTQGDWKLVELYGKTGPKQMELQIAARLGGYGALSTGKAYFDDIFLEEVKSVPKGIRTVSFLAKEVPSTTPGVKISSLPIVLFSGAFFIFFALIYVFVLRRSNLQWTSVRKLNIFLFIILFIALGIRLWLAAAMNGQYPLLVAFKIWIDAAALGGFSEFYKDAMHLDYSPGYVYILIIVDWVSRILSIGYESAGFKLLLKLPAIVADLVTIFLLYRIAIKRLGSASAIGITLLYALNPAILIPSVAWGQNDSLFTLFIVWMIWLLVKEKLEGAAVVFAVAMLIKPQAVIFLPLMIFVLIQWRSWLKAIYCMVIGAITFVIVGLPLSIHQHWTWSVKLYTEMLTSLPFATLNGFNLFALTGANGLANDDSRLFLTYHTFSMIFLALIIAVSAYVFFRTKLMNLQSKYFVIALFLITAFFMLTSNMRESSMFPVLLLALLCYIYAKDRRLLQVFLGFSLTLFINISEVLAYSHLNIDDVPAMDGLLMLTSLTNVVLFGYLIYIACDVLLRERILFITEQAPLPKDEIQVPIKETWLTRKDWLWMSGVTLLYAMLALYNLGSTKSPETDWQPARSGDTFYVDLGSVKAIERVNTFSAIGDGKYKLEFAETDLPIAWINAKSVELDYGKVFNWMSTVVTQSARYVKVTVETPGFVLREMAFFEKDVQTPLTIQSLHAEGAGTAFQGVVDNLFDEQMTAKYKPSFMDGTYFDEIYHARTAFENLHMMKQYENTHPPLGKLLISIGIRIFGMNPFGWRIVGTLFGIAMIPIMYVFAKRLFGRTEYAIMAAFLMSVDFMHFVQTRISTIDVYGVFFIMLMYYFMFRYFTLNFFQVSLRKTLLPLFLSGLFFGIGAASKWIVIYGGGGLALIFFLSLYDRYKEYEAAKIHLINETSEPSVGLMETDELEPSRQIVASFTKLSIKSVAWCTLFFVFIPLIVYSLSFFPIMAVEGEKHTITQLIKYQTDMFDYHSELVATHPFSSPWYEWPAMIRPIWFYSNSFAPAGLAQSIVSMGNPLIWWLGLPAIFAAIIISRIRKDKGMYVVLIAFLSQYVPWILISRVTFIYHFFAMVPFIILCLTYLMKQWIESRQSGRKWCYTYLMAAFLLFVMFYPVLSGMQVSKMYIDYGLRWFYSWSF